jgi:hypothetical protein
MEEEKTLAVRLIFNNPLQAARVAMQISHAKGVATFANAMLKKDNPPFPRPRRNTPNAQTPKCYRPKSYRRRYIDACKHE